MTRDRPALYPGETGAGAGLCALFAFSRRRGAAHRHGRAVFRLQCRERRLSPGRLRGDLGDFGDDRRRRNPDRRNAGAGSRAAKTRALRRLPPAHRRICLRQRIDPPCRPCRRRAILGLRRTSSASVRVRLAGAKLTSFSGIAAMSGAVDQSLQILRAQGVTEPVDFAVLLGFGLGGMAEGLAGAISMPYADLPCLPPLDEPGQARPADHRQARGRDHRLPERPGAFLQFRRSRLHERRAGTGQSAGRAAIADFRHRRLGSPGPLSRQSGAGHRPHAIFGPQPTDRPDRPARLHGPGRRL